MNATLYSNVLNRHQNVVLTDDPTVNSVHYFCFCIFIVLVSFDAVGPHREYLENLEMMVNSFESQGILIKSLQCYVVCGESTARMELELNLTHFITFHCSIYQIVRGMCIRRMAMYNVRAMLYFHYLNYFLAIPIKCKYF